VRKPQPIPAGEQALRLLRSRADPEVASRLHHLRNAPFVPVFR